jgi:hypothetical protein
MPTMVTKVEVAGPLYAWARQRSGIFQSVERLPVGGREWSRVGGVADKMSSSDIVSELPDLAPEDVSEALRYAAQALLERELPLRHSARDF